jgi:hypothetical protein
MTKARLDGLQMVIVGSVFFIAVGALMEHFNALGMTDFLQIYVSSRCVAQHHDPYDSEALQQFYRAEASNLPSGSSARARTRREIVLVANNLPTTLFLIAPLAVLPWKAAAVVWMALIAVCFVLACFLVWRFGADSAPRVYGALIALILVNSGLLIETGNTAGLVVSLTVIAACCFLQDRFAGWVPAAGVACLAIALAIKPHDAGPFWLYFLLAGGMCRRRALQALALTAVIIVATILWVSHAAPHWLPELQSNLAGGFAAGGINNPGASTHGARGIGQIVSLQAMLSVIRDDARFYNSLTYAVCGVLLLLWCVRTLRVGFSPRTAWFALAAMAPLAMLPFYHRTYDARLLLLGVPACAALWMERGTAGRAGIGHSALWLTLAAILLTGDIFWVVFFQITHYSRTSLVFGMIPAPLALLAAGIFYLFVYLRMVPDRGAAS